MNLAKRKMPALVRREQAVLLDRAVPESKVAIRRREMARVSSTGVVLRMPVPKRLP